MNASETLSQNSDSLDNTARIDTGTPKKVVKDNPNLSYSEALTKSSMSTFQDRRELLYRKLFMEIVDNKGHKLPQVLPPLNAML